MLFPRIFKFNAHLQNVFAITVSICMTAVNGHLVDKTTWLQQFTQVGKKSINHINIDVIQWWLVNGHSLSIHSNYWPFNETIFLSLNSQLKHSSAANPNKFSLLMICRAVFCAAGKAKFLLKYLAPFDRMSMTYFSIRWQCRKIKLAYNSQTAQCTPAQYQSQRKPSHKTNSNNNNYNLSQTG